jgi:hypothetical protein
MPENGGGAGFFTQKAQNAKCSYLIKNDVDNIASSPRRGEEI